MVHAIKGRKTTLDSPESLVIPYDDINAIQQKITGEKFPSLTLGICDNCTWCYSCINMKGILNGCPMCGEVVSQIPIGIDEFCILEAEPKRGITMSFNRKLPMR